MKKEKKLFNLKISDEVKKELELASSLSGLSMTSIMVSASLKEAKKIIKDFEKGK